MQRIKPKSSVAVWFYFCSYECFGDLFFFLVFEEPCVYTPQALKEQVNHANSKCKFTKRFWNIFWWRWLGAIFKLLSNSSKMLWFQIVGLVRRHRSTQLGFMASELDKSTQLKLTIPNSCSDRTPGYFMDAASRDSSVSFTMVATFLGRHDCF